MLGLNYSHIIKVAAQKIVLIVIEVAKINLPDGDTALGLGGFSSVVKLS